MAIDWLTGASVASSLLGSGISSSLSGSASKKAQREQMDALARQAYEQNAASTRARSDLSPYLQTGTQANNELARLLGIGIPSGYAPQPTLQQFQDQLRAEHFNRFGKDYGRNSNVAEQNVEAQRRYDAAMGEWQSGLEAARESDPGGAGSGWLTSQFSNEDFVKDPGYEFRLAEGNKGIDRASAARGGYDSGATLKALARYNQDFASNEFQNAYNRDSANKQRTYNFLSGTAGAGQNAANTLAGVGQNAANNINSATQNATNQNNAYAFENAANQNNSIMSGIGNALYALRTSQTQPTTGGYPGSNYGSSRQTTTPWYL